MSQSWQPCSLAISHPVVSEMGLSSARNRARNISHFGGGPNIEEEAHRFASEFLMPAAEIKTSLHRLDISKLASLRQYWKVSRQALVMRAYRLKTITEAQMRYLFIQFSQGGYCSREPEELDIPVEKPALLNMTNRRQ